MINQSGPTPFRVGVSGGGGGPTPFRVGVSDGSDVKQPPTQQQLVESWAKITLERFRESIDKLGIGVTGNLRDKMMRNIISGSDGNVAAVELKFLYYGRFVDMGVGRGVPIGGKASNPNFYDYRKRQNWYSTNKTREVHKLRELLAQNFGVRIVYDFESNIDGQQTELEV